MTVPRRHRPLLVLWPAFLGACVLELVVFAFVDPVHIHPSSTAVYTIAFFMFWAVIAASAAVTQWLAGDTPEPSPPRAPDLMPWKPR